MMVKNLNIFIILLLFTFSCASSSGSKRKENLVVSSSSSGSSTPSKSSSEEDPAKKIAQNIILNINKLPNKRVAVADFTDIEGNETVEGKLLAEQIITYLVQNTNVKVIERKQLNKVLEEQKLTMLGLTESDNAQKVGKILNVDGIVSGTITYLEDSKEINARMIEVNTGIILCAVPVRLRHHKSKMNIARLSPEEREKLEKEFAEREKERKRNPELFRIKAKHHKELAKLRETNPKLYFKVIKTIRIMERLKNERPRVFLLVTESPNSPKINKLKQRAPRRFQKVKELRKMLKFITDNSPAYRQKLLYDRREIMRRLK